MSRGQQWTAAFLTSPVSPCLLLFPPLHLKLHPSAVSGRLPSFVKQTTTTCVPAKREQALIKPAVLLGLWHRQQGEMPGSANTLSASTSLVSLQTPILIYSRISNVNLLLFSLKPLLLPLPNACLQAGFQLSCWPAEVLGGHRGQKLPGVSASSRSLPRDLRRANDLTDCRRQGAAFLHLQPGPG